MLTIFWIYGIMRYNYERRVSMKLTTEQQKMVEDNHNLIYWYIHSKNLNLDDWYDLLAIELCITAIKYKPERGSFSNYFKLRADGMLSKEYNKAQSIKRKGTTVEYLDDVVSKTRVYNLEDDVILNDMMNSKDSHILKMKSEGYTQAEIAEVLDVSQSYISKLLKQVKKEYYGEGV